MDLSQFERQIESTLKWKKIKELPNFPIIHLEELKKKINSGEYSISIDFTTANEFARGLYGARYAIFFFVLASTPFIVATLSVILAFILKNYYLLFGIISAFAGFFLSNPYNPFKSFWKSMVGILLLVCFYGIWRDNLMITFLSGFFIIPFFVNEFIYNLNRNKLKEIALNSEKIFIFLFQNGKLRLINNKTGESYWYQEMKSLNKQP